MDGMIGRINPRPSMWIEIHDGGEGPKPGNYIVTTGKKIDSRTGAPQWNSAYLVLHARKVKRRDPRALPRYRLKTLRVQIEEVMAPDFVMRWFPRKKRCPTLDKP